MPTDATIAPASRATDGMPMQGIPTDGILKEGILTEGILKEGLATARRPRRVLAAAGPAVSRILRQTIGQNSVLRIAQASLMGYKAWPFCAVRVGRTANQTANPIRTSRPRPGDING